MKKLNLMLLVVISSNFSIKGMEYLKGISRLIETKQTFLETKKNKFMNKEGLSEEAAEKEAHEKYRKKMKELNDLYLKSLA